VFFVDDAESSWNDSARDAYRDILGEVVRTLEKEEGGRTGLKVSWSVENRKMNGVFSSGRDAHDVIPALLGVSGKVGVTKLQNEFRKANGYDETPLLFVWNRDFRSSAHQSESESAARCVGEWATIALDDDIFKNPHGVWFTLLHELLHLFGAVDFYYPSAVKIAAEKWLQGSVMNGGDAIDDLTRVLIGWNDQLTSNAVDFLEATKDVTAKEIDDAREAEGRKWHESGES
jgi:hypothetical protein